jgi:hypothetical protein
VDGLKALVRRVWVCVLASFRLTGWAVCEAATYGYDRHDYQDSVENYPDHFVLLKCRRCGHKFYI